MSYQERSLITLNNESEVPSGGVDSALELVSGPFSAGFDFVLSGISDFK